MSASGILVWGETEDNELSSAVFELLGMARGLVAQQGGLVTVVVTAEVPEEMAHSLVARGADRVLVAKGAVPKSGVEGHLHALEAAAAEISPALVLLPHSSYGAELAPRLGCRLESAAAMDCLGSRVSEAGTLLLIRQCYGGKARAEVSFGNTPGVATVRARSQTPLVPEPERTGEVRELALAPAPEPRTHVLARRGSPSDALRLEDARIVVAGGRGVGGTAGFALLEALADVLGAAVGASRPACDLGWYPHTRQIGVTGKTVAPELYFAVGISGASQHMAGCGGAKVLVAINNDPSAAIFSFAHLGIVGSFEEIVPLLADALAGDDNAVSHG